MSAVHQQKSSHATDPSATFANRARDVVVRLFSGWISMTNHSDELVFRSGL